MLKVAILVLLAALLAHRGAVFYRIFDLHKSAADLAPSHNFGQCRVVTALPTEDLSGTPQAATAARLDLHAIPGYEDIALLDQQTGISCAGDLHSLWHNPAYRSIGSQCVLIHLQRTMVGASASGASDTDGAAGRPYVSIEPLAITGFTMRNGRQQPVATQQQQAGTTEEAAAGSDKPFQPKGQDPLTALNLNLHGLTIVRDPRPQLASSLSYLFALNHAYEHGDERIEVFRIDEPNLQLHHVFSILFPAKTIAMYRGSLNDLVVSDFQAKPQGMLLSGSVYVSSWLELADPIGNRVGDTVLMLRRKALLFGRGFIDRFDNKVIRCSFDTSDLFQHKCAFKTETLAKCDDTYVGGFAIGNGLAKVTLANLVWPGAGNKAVEVVFAVDVLQHAIRAFVSPPMNGPESATTFGAGPFPFLPAEHIHTMPVLHAIDNLEPAVASVVCEHMAVSAHHGTGGSRGAGAASSKEQLAALHAAAVSHFTCRVVLYSGFIGSILQATKLDKGVDDTLSPGGIAQHTVQLNISVSTSARIVVLDAATMLEDTTRVMTDGVFNGLSAGVVLRDGEAEFAVMGSFKSVGVMVCPLA